MEIIERCRDFEEKNDKDIGLIGHKLVYLLNFIIYIRFFIS